MPGILVWIETSGGEVRKASREAAGAALRLCEKLGAPAAAVLCGPDASAAAALGKLGFAKVFTASGESLVSYSAEAYAGALAEAGARLGADTYLMAATSPPAWRPGSTRPWPWTSPTSSGTPRP